MKKVLIDLSILKHFNCGLGQVAYNYAKYYQEHAKELDLEIHLLLPSSYVGAFGPDVFYHKSNFFSRTFPSFLLLKFDVWHSIHQLSRYNPPADRFTKNVLTIHDLNFLYEKTGASLERNMKNLTKKIERADKIVCISQFSKNDVEKHFKTREPVEVIYNGVEYITAEGETVPQGIADPSKKFLFSIGQMFPKKNFHVLLDAMKKMPEFNLFIAGKNNTEYASMIQKRIQDENITNVFLLGEVLHSEKLWLYNHCEAFVFPSLFEGFGLPIIEAMHLGKPVVSSDKTSLKEIGGDHVFFLNSFEADDIANTVRNAISSFNPSMATANKQYADSFTYERHLKRYIEIFNEI